MDLYYSLAGLIVGFIVGLTGVGGGSLMTPILVLFFGIKPVVAVGTDLLFAAITKSGGVFVHQKRRTIQWRIVGLMALGSIPATMVSILVLKHLDMTGADYNRLITTTLSIALILTSLAILFREPLKRMSQTEKMTWIRVMHQRYCKHMTILAGALIGTLVTLSSVGAGALGAAILFFLYPRIPAIGIVGTDIAHAVPITAISGLGHLHLGTVDLVLLASLLVGSLPGIYLGSHIGTLLPDKIMRPALASMLLLIGLRLAV